MLSSADNGSTRRSGCCSISRASNATAQYGGTLRLQVTGPRLQDTAYRASFAFQVLQALKVVYALCLLFSLFEALHAIPSIALITSALAKCVAPLLELALSGGVVSILLAMMLLIEAPSDERMTNAPLLLSYMMNGVITGALCVLYTHAI